MLRRLMLGWFFLIAPGTAHAAPTPPAHVMFTPLLTDDTSLGTISGRVMRDDGLPAVGFIVGAIPASEPMTPFFQSNPNQTVTDADGRYTIFLQPMAFSYYSVVDRNAKGYLVSVSSGAQPYVASLSKTVDPADWPDRMAMGADFVLRLGPQITVRVRDAITGAPNAGLKVRYGPGTEMTEFGVERTAGVTGPDGLLRFRLPLTFINLQANLPDALEAAPGYGFGQSCFTQITAKPGQKVVWDLKTYGAQYDSDWHGLVLEPNGRPAVGVIVMLQRQYERGVILITDARGRYSSRLPRLKREEATQGSWINPPLIYARRGTLMAVQKVTPEQSWNGMTLRLRPGAALSGTLIDPQGRPAASVGVSLSGAILGVNGMAFPLPQTNTDAQGRFRFVGLPPGKYLVRATGSGYGTVNIPPLQPGSVMSLPALTEGEHWNLGRRIIPRADRALTGTVTDTQGRPVTEMNVAVTGAHTQQYAAVQQDGTFRVDGLVDEPLTMTLIGTGNMPTAAVSPGQKTVHLVVPLDVVVANAPPPAPPPAPTPRGEPTVFPQGADIPLNGLVLTLRPETDGRFTATLLRPDEIRPAWLYFSTMMDFPGSTLATLWQGRLEDVEGMRMTVRHDHGTVTDRTGRVLWSGVVQDPPDYVLTINVRSHAGTVRDEQGRTLWSGVADPNDTIQLVRDGILRVFGPGHAEVWQHAVGNARVAMNMTGWDYPLPSSTPVDGVLTLRVTPSTGTLRAADSRVLWSGPSSVITTRVTGSLALQWPPRTDTLLGIQNPPPGGTLTFTDAAGQILSGPITYGYPR